MESPLPTEPQQTTESPDPAILVVKEFFRAKKQWQKMQDFFAERGRDAQTQAHEELVRLALNGMIVWPALERLAASSGGDMEQLTELAKRVGEAYVQSGYGRWSDEEIAQWRKGWEDLHAWYDKYAIAVEAAGETPGLVARKEDGSVDVAKQYEHDLARQKELLAKAAKAQGWSDEQVAKALTEEQMWLWLEDLAMKASSGEDLDRLAEVAKEGYLIGSDEEVDAWRKRWEEWHAQRADSFKGAEMDRVAESLRAHGFSDEEVASWRKGWEDWHARRAQNAPDALDVVDDGRLAVVVDDGRLADETDADTVVTVTSDSDSDAGP
jgi:hypothetical protein